MGLYSIARYEVDRYGEAPRLAFSVAPFLATAIPGVEGGAYSTVQLYWGEPQGDISRIRLLRSQDGFPETEEDGLTLWSWESASGAPTLDAFVDSPATSTIPLISGRYAYYRIWVFTEATSTWLVAGDALTIVPAPHDSLASDGTTLLSTHDKFMDLLPRVFTGANQSPLDVLDTTSTLYNFLKGFSFTLDEIMTLADNILPEESGSFINPELIILKALNLGLEPEAYIATKNQKRLVREAVYMHTNKGTKNAIETYTESLTGFAPTVSSSPNLLLSIQDSSFYKGLGNWSVAGNADLAVEQTVVPLSETLVPYAVDYAYTAKVTSNEANVYLRNGLSSSRVLGAPIVSDTEYTLQAAVQSNTGSGNTITAKLYWYDYLGELLSTSTGTPTAITDDTWDTVSVTAAAPAEAIYAGVEFKLATQGITYFDMVQVAESSVTDYYEARAIDIFLAPKKTNEIKSPSFELSGSANWTVVAEDSEYITPTTLTGGPYGEYMLQVDGTNAGTTSIATDTGVVDSGKYYTFSIYARMSGITVLSGSVTNEVATVTLASTHPWGIGDVVTVQSFAGLAADATDLFSPFNGTHVITAVTSTTLSFAIDSVDIAVTTANVAARVCRPETMTLRLNSYDELAAVGEEVSDVHEETYTFDNVWRRYSVTGFVSSTDNPVYLQLSVYSNTVGCIMQFDAAQVEASFSFTDYFDGGAPVSYGAVWENGANNSRSHIYPNKDIKTLRLAETLKNWIPINRALTIRTYAGIEHKIV